MKKKGRRKKGTGMALYKIVERLWSDRGLAVRDVLGMNAATRQDQDWRTPPWLFEVVERLAGGKIDLDPCSDEHNPLGVAVFYTAKEDGLAQPWSRPDVTRVYVNPPYKQVSAWVEKTIREVDANEDLIIYFLVPAFTDQPWYERALAWATEEWSVKGRVRFLRPDGSPATSPRFPSTLFGFGHTFGGTTIPLPGECVKIKGRAILRGVIYPPHGARGKRRTADWTSGVGRR
jgi:phage N-6-adenine-methyltransferase